VTGVSIGGLIFLFTWLWGFNQGETSQYAKEKGSKSKKWSIVD
jgi:hypothetical protein